MTIAELREAMAIASDPGVKAGEWACAQSTLDLAMPGLVDLAEAVGYLLAAPHSEGAMDDLRAAYDKVVKS